MARRKGKVFIAFVDYLKAFDTVDRHSLWLCLRRKGLSRKMLNRLKSLYRSVLCCVRYGHDYTEFFESSAGMKQGCLLGPKTWCPFINEVADEIKKAGRHGILLTNLTEEIFSLFADDVALVFTTTKFSSGTAKSTKRAGTRFRKDRT